MCEFLTNLVFSYFVEIFCRTIGIFLMLNRTFLKFVLFVFNLIDRHSFGSRSIELHISVASLHVYRYFLIVQRILISLKSKIIVWFSTEILILFLV